MVNNIHTNAKLTKQPQQKIRNPPPDFSRQRHNLVAPGAAIIRQTTGQSTDPRRHRVVLRDKSQPMIPALMNLHVTPSPRFLQQMINVSLRPLLARF